MRSAFVVCVTLTAFALLTSIPVASRAEGRNSLYLDFGPSAGSFTSGPVGFAGIAHTLTPATRWTVEMGIGPRPPARPLYSIPEISAAAEPYSPLLMASTGIEWLGPLQAGSRIFVSGTGGLAYAREEGSATTAMSWNSVFTSSRARTNLWSAMVGASLGMRGNSRGLWPAPRLTMRAAYLPGFRGQDWLMAGTVGVDW